MADQSIDATRGRVVALPGADRAEDALKFLSESVAAGDRGVILVLVDSDGFVSARCYGEVRRFEFAYAGTMLSDYAINGDFETGT